MSSLRAAGKYLVDWMVVGILFCTPFLIIGDVWTRIVSGIGIGFVTALPGACVLAALASRSNLAIAKLSASVSAVSAIWLAALILLWLHHLDSATVITSAFFGTIIGGFAFLFARIELLKYRTTKAPTDVTSPET